MQETWVRSLDWEDPLEEGMATHSSILPGESPWTEEPGGLQFMGSQRLSTEQFSSVWSLSLVWLSVAPWTAACQASLSITNCQSLLKLMSIKSVMPSNHLMLWRIELSIWMVQSEELKHWGEWKWWSWGQNLDFLKQIPSSYKTRRQIIVTYPPSLPTVS